MKNNNKDYNKRANKKNTISDKAIPIKKLKTVMISGCIILFLLVIRLFWIQFIDGAWLKERAFRQQTDSKGRRYHHC